MKKSLQLLKVAIVLSLLALLCLAPAAWADGPDDLRINKADDYPWITGPGDASRADDSPWVDEHPWVDNGTRSEDFPWVDDDPYPDADDTPWTEEMPWVEALLMGISGTLEIR